MEKFGDSVEDTLCVGQQRPEDSNERMLLFVKMRSGQKLSQDLRKRINEEITRSLSPRHVPSFIFEVEDIPVRAISMQNS